MKCKKVLSRLILNNQKIIMHKSSNKHLQNHPDIFTEVCDGELAENTNFSAELDYPEIYIYLQCKKCGNITRHIR